MSKKKTAKISTLGSQAASVASVTLVLLMLGTIAWLALAAGRLANTALGDVAIIVKLDPNASDQQVQSLNYYFHHSPFAAETIFTSADQVLEQEMEYNAEVLQLLEENPYSSEFEIKLSPQYVHPDSIIILGNNIALRPGVEDVVSQADMVRAVSSAVSKTTIVLSSVAAILLVISIVLIFNTVSIGVYGRRFIIRTMQLVGATGSYIRRPFLRAGLLSGLLSGVLASGILIAGQAWAQSSAIDFSLDIGAGAVAIICGGMILLGLAICGLSALWATNRYLRASYDALYRA